MTKDIIKSLHCLAPSVDTQNLSRRALIDQAQPRRWLSLFHLSETS